MNSYLKSILGKQGILAQSIPYYEYRKEQLAMSQLVGYCLLNGQHAVIEAGTGIGKSFAYLLPSIRYVLQKKNKIIISTKTINLQEQIFKKDIPALQKILNEDIKIVLAKGRNNYLCLKKLQSTAQLSLLENQSEIERVHLQAAKSKTGDKEEFSCSNEMWEQICSDSDTCVKKACPHFSECFFYKAKKEQENADIILVNHALFFADLAIKKSCNFVEDSGILSDYEAVVFDEAHHLEDIATQFMGIRINYYTFKLLFDQINMNINSRSPLGQAIGSHDRFFDNMQNFLREFNDKALKFFGDAHDYLNELSNKRLREDERGFQENYLSPLLLSAIGQLEMIKDTYPLSDEFVATIDNLACKALAIKEGLEFFLDQIGNDEFVYWLEKTSTKDSKLKNVTLAAAPISVAEILEEALFDRVPSVILTSATLSVNNDFQYLTSRLGLAEGKYQKLLSSSPFDYEKQCLLYLPQNAPDPRADDFNDYLVKAVKELTLISQGRAFVLFTSYKSMQYVYSKLEDFFLEQNFPAFIQGERRRDLLLKEFKNQPNSILFGTDSFWEGVDVQGEALSCVIIAKLPFVVPNHPVIEARSEYLKSKQLNPFIVYSLPQAVLKLKQGFGRLIRSKTDKGIVAVLDKRIIQAFYGKQFLKSLPPASRTSSLEEVNKFFTTLPH